MEGFTMWQQFDEADGLRDKEKWTQKTKQKIVGLEKNIKVKDGETFGVWILGTCENWTRLRESITLSSLTTGLHQGNR